MPTIRIRLPFLIFGILLLAVGANFSALTLRQSNAADAKDSKLNKLLHDRLGVFQEVANLAEKGFKNGEYDYFQLYTAKVELRRAQLDVCVTDADRIAVLEKSLVDATEREKIVQRFVKDGEVTAFTALRAKADCLEIEIELERLKIKN